MCVWRSGARGTRLRLTRHWAVRAMHESDSVRCADVPAIEQRGHRRHLTHHRSRTPTPAHGSRRHGTGRRHLFWHRGVIEVPTCLRVLVTVANIDIEPETVIRTLYSLQRLDIWVIWPARSRIDAHEHASRGGGSGELLHRAVRCATPLLHLGIAVIDDIVRA